MTDYQPVDCGLHSEYEVAILRRRRLRLTWSEPGGRTGTAIVDPVDLITQNHEEYLCAETRDGKAVRLRLDRIKKAEPV